MSPDINPPPTRFQRAQPVPDLHTLGNPTLLTRPTLALICSAQAPPGVLLAVHDLACHWREAGPVIMSGFQSPVEAEALTVLLPGPQPMVLWLARGLYRRVPARLQPALDAGRLLVVSIFPEPLHRPSRETARRRNLAMCAAADAVLVAHVAPAGHTAMVAAELLAVGKPVYTVDHPANRQLVAAGAPVYTGHAPSVVGDRTGT